ncbi:hypothetical protein [Aeromicrobium sp. 179-A 4D2 NHS]|uniref:hypothetical protein n=1 Tax=Aeromicrobium sp. 179-A 4D2 NHS TaxID=3142375 RepID=UPI0039A262D9
MPKSGQDHMKSYAVTFPERYRNRPHRSYKAITPDRYFVIDADNIEDACDFATFWFGEAYEAVLEAADAEQAHPNGLIGRAVVSPGLLSVVHSR